jgi:hypothetical protein
VLYPRRWHSYVDIYKPTIARFPHTVQLIVCIICKLTLYFNLVNFNIIIPSTSMFPDWSRILDLTTWNRDNIENQIVAELVKTFFRIVPRNRTGYRLDKTGIGYRFSAEPRGLSLFHKVQASSGAHLTSYPVELFPR